MPITSEPAPSLRPWASATGATPLRTMFNLTCPPKCWVKIGHFYFAGNRTFLLCLDNIAMRRLPDREAQSFLELLQEPPDRLAVLQTGGLIPKILSELR